RQHTRAAGRVGSKRRPLLQATAGTRCRWCDRHATRQKREVGEDVSHVGSGRIDRRAVHAAAEAVVDAVFDGLHHAAARPVLWIAREHPNPGPILAPALLQMTTRKAQLVTEVPRQTVMCCAEKG